MQQRIIGFDLARAYAIFGMYIVNFNIVFGNYQDKSVMGQVLSLFSGNSSSLFVMLAGMGLSLLAGGKAAATAEGKRQLRRTVHKRGLFLFVSGLLLYNWWPADILHFYGGYMHIAAAILFVPTRYYLWVAIGAVAVFHLLLLVIPYETGWDFNSLQYQDFWTVGGFLRNTLYNGWNPIFPWMAYFAMGMFLGRLDWSNRLRQRNWFLIGLALFLSIYLLQMGAQQLALPETVQLVLQADYLPPFLPFLLSTTGVCCMLIAAFVRWGQAVGQHPLAMLLARTGQMTLTHYLLHLTLGLSLLALLSGQNLLTMSWDTKIALPPLYILLYATGWFVASVEFSHWWGKRFTQGPFEKLMRRWSG
jgi:uncharacterized protein